MKIQWLGHSCFLITSEKGTRIITDPFQANQGLTYKEVSLEADIITVSHGHNDHSNAEPVKGNPEILKSSVNKTVKDIGIRALSTWHDASQGKERGHNLAFCFNMDGINVCHMGDLGHLLQKTDIEALGRVDVMLVPVGGVFTLDAGQSVQLCKDVKPSIVIPMHYKTEHCAWLKWTAEDFARGIGNYRTLDSNEIEIFRGKLPKSTEVVILKYKE